MQEPSRMDYSRSHFYQETLPRKGASQLLKVRGRVVGLLEQHFREHGEYIRLTVVFLKSRSTVALLYHKHWGKLFPGGELLIHHCRDNSAVVMPFSGLWYPLCCVCTELFLNQHQRRGGCAAALIALLRDKEFPEKNRRWLTRKRVAYTLHKNSRQSNMLIRPRPCSISSYTGGFYPWSECITKPLTELRKFDILRLSPKTR